VAQQVTGKEYVSGSVRIWIPDGIDVIRGVWWIVERGVTRPAYDDVLNSDYLQWKDDPYRPDGVTSSAGNRPFAASMGLAMAYDANDMGSGTDVFAKLREFASRSGHPELEYTGYIPCGISGGGNWATCQFERNPQRLITGFPSHSSNNISNMDEAIKVPRLDFIAEADYMSDHPQVDNLPWVLQGRAMNAPWCGFVSWGDGHHYWTYTELKMMQMWMADVLPLRLPDEIPTNRLPEYKTVTVPTEGCWLGSFDYTKWPMRLSNLRIAPCDRFEGDKSKAYYLPSQEFARQWAEWMGFDPGPVMDKYRPMTLRVMKNAQQQVRLPGAYTATGRLVPGNFDGSQKAAGAGVYIFRTNTGGSSVNAVISSPGLQ
jgi:hypothetical protein